MSCYYNDNNPFAADWLRNLSAAGLIMSGDVDTRSITEIGNLEDYTRVHLFAGIGGWDYALQLAGWPRDLPVWTGSCPCQPFSVAGKRRGTEDERHLWPHMLRLISECRPPVVFGEQVASKDGRAWLARVRADLEALGYAVGAADLCAAGVGAPHIRQRLYWVADSANGNWGGRECATEAGTGTHDQRGQRPAGSSGGCGLGDATCKSVHQCRVRRGATETPGAGTPNERVGDSLCSGSSLHGTDEPEQQLQAVPGNDWVSAEVLCGADGSSRRIEPGLAPLAYGIPRSVADARARLAGMVDVTTGTLRDARRCRTGSLRGYGNAIVPQVAAAFVRAYMAARAVQ